MKPYYEHAGITIYHGDCREILPTLEKVDLVLTDPPYGIGASWAEREWVTKTFTGSSRLWGKGEKWDDSTPDEYVIERAVKAGTAAIVWGGNYFNLPPARQWLVWDKIQKFSGADAELAWTNLGGSVRCFRMSRVEAFGNNCESKKVHPTEKPMALMRWCVDQVKTDVSSILDPFMGSGTTLRVAKDLGIGAVGVELEEKYCEMAANRLAQEVLFPA
jgi:DNA modification methylase